MLSGIVTKISLSVSIITFAVLVMMVSIVMVDHNGNYGSFIQAQAITHQNIPYATAIAGLLLILLCSLISWFVSLYSSFRIAGPLYRFSQNLRHSHNSKQMLALREDDCLQDLSKKIISAAKQSEIHKQKMLLQIEQCQKIMAQSLDKDVSKNEREYEDTTGRLSNALNELKKIDRQAKLGGLE